LSRFLARWYGIARSALICHGDPGRRRRARALYSRFVPRGGLCFDIGAHLGDRTGHFLALGARVVALEPQPAPMRILRLLYGRNPNVALVEAAVGAEPGRAQLLAVPANPTVASLSPAWVAAVSRSAGFHGLAWEDGGEVEVTTWGEDDEVGVTVTDNGPGIPTEARELIFERFYRADPARGRDVGGSGLGLAICREVAKAHGGRVWVESEEGKGSAFSLALPRASDSG